MQNLILCVLFLFLMAGIYWMTGRILSLLGINSKKRSIRILRICISILIIVLCRLWMTTGLIAIHFIAAVAVIDFAAFVIRHIGKRWKKGRSYQILRRIYHSCALPLLIVFVLLGYGYYNMNHIVQTEYTVASEKLSKDYQIVLITDTHYGTVQNTDVLKNAVWEINDLFPDIVILGGDIVEEGTSKEDMREVFEVLGGLNSTYGIYYVYGNHDRQSYMSDNRTYTDEELVSAIESNGITILSDKAVLIGDDLVLAGREDAASPSGRLSCGELLKGADKNQFIIMADHQPVEAEENAKAGVDLELSGHTHAGQIFPAGYLTELFGLMNYGEYQKDGCKVIVSSGATGWGFPIRTQEHCEYAVIHLKSSVENSDGKEQSVSFFAMDTYMKFTVYGEDAAALTEAKQQIETLEHLWSVSEDTSDIYQLNHSNGAAVTVHKETGELLSYALTMAELTDGALEPTLYPLLTAWGFTTDSNRIPQEQEIKQLLEKTGYQNIRLKGCEVQLEPGMMLDLGAVGKGYAGDMAVQILREKGVASALLNLGGNIQTIGKKPDGSPWRLGIKSPFGSGMIGTLETSDNAVVTSGNYERYFVGEDGNLYGHILNPETGYPVNNDLASVTVVAKEGKLCDAMSTALFVMGLQDAQAFWYSQQNFDMILVTQDGEIYLTKDLENKFTVNDECNVGKIHVIKP